MTNLALNTLARVMQNKHTSGAAVAYALLKIGGVWFPKYKDQFDQTAAIAVAYGLVMAGDAPKPEIRDGNMPSVPDNQKQKGN